MQYNQPGRRDARPQVDFWLWNGERFMARDMHEDRPFVEPEMWAEMTAATSQAATGARVSG